MQVCFSPWVNAHTLTHTHTEPAVRKAVSAAISFSPTQTQWGLCVQSVVLIPEQIHLRDRCRRTNSLSYSHTHTHTQAKLMTSILQAQIEVLVLAANNSQFSRCPRGREGGWEGGRRAGEKKLRENWCFHPVLKIMTHLGKALQQGEHVCLLSRRPAEHRHYHWCYTNASGSRPQ